MSRFAVLTALAVAALTVCVFVSSAAARPTSSHGSWIPGTPTMVAEDEASGLLEQTWDHAYCNGIPRFGHSGEFPDEMFVVFDCDVSMGGKNPVSCTDARYRTFKDKQRDFFRIRNIAQGDCF